MKYQLLVSLFCLSFSVFSQSSFPKMWKTKKTKTLFEHDITKKEGQKRATPYIYFKTLDQIKQEYKELSSTQMWPADSLENLNAILDKNAKGGEIGVKLVANTVEKANTKNLTIIIQDNEGNEVHREQLENNIPSVSSAGGYVLCTSIDIHFIPVELKAPFKVFLINSVYSQEKYSKTVYLVEN